MQNQFLLVWTNLVAMGSKRLAILFTTAVVILATVGIGAKYVNKPASETLYVGLERDDINRIGIVLAEAGIGYDVDISGTSVLVESGKSSKARMILAEKGLPGSSGSGYELFDNLGSLGLTSFMQEVTRIRVLEGEIARSIQSIHGIKAARVHIVQPDRRSFSSRSKVASASVLIRTKGTQQIKAANSIRHLVAAAVPHLSFENVTVLDTAGQLLASGDDPTRNSLNNSISVQKMVEGQLAQNVINALSPYMGGNNIRVNIQATVNTDKRQIEEITFDPESRVERSLQVVKTQDTSSQKSSGQTASVEQNLPNAEAKETEGPQSSKASDRREETTNYEINSKKVATVSSGYSVQKISVSVIVNKKRLEEVLGEDANPKALKSRVAEIQKIAMAAVGLDAARGDVIDVTAVDFIDELDGVVIPEIGLIDKLSGQLGSMVNSLSYLIGIVLLLLFGVKPLIASLSQNSSTSQEVKQLANPDEGGGELFGPDEIGRLGSPEDEGSFGLETQLNADTDSLFASLAKTPQERLEELAVKDEEASSLVLRRWVGAEAA